VQEFFQERAYYKCPHNSTFNEEVSATGFKPSEVANSASPITGSIPSEDSQKVEKALSGTSES
jgi:hypothetical protein